MLMIKKLKNSIKTKFNNIKKYFTYNMQDLYFLIGFISINIFITAKFGLIYLFLILAITSFYKCFTTARGGE